MKHNATPRPFNPDFVSKSIGTPERFIHGVWQLGMMRFHAFSDECDEEVREVYNHINHELGAKTIYVDLCLLGENYRDESQIIDIIRGNQPTWVWFVNCQILLDNSLAGWLRSVLTTYNVDHVRATFVLDSQDQYNEIFLTYSAPFYKSTIALKT
ncbi:hypothetical protein [Vibrio tapetis]|uniref:Uncharacterized protein n=1 Tax=Vibrio tapetis subsp. tapetis TaxID=1671868 RepID=A0A2N8ZAS6_9VIBR|nr:hypothetical protein [Vibrio tapetis]SON49020.1 conserved protein of unknown function [Vibrio tapetis subsp. tapetis]